MSPLIYDVAVVGAGLIGTSIAYHAARAGHRVVLLDRAGVGAGASGASFGWVGAQFATYARVQPAFHDAFLAEAMAYYRQGDERFVAATGYERRGGLVLAYTPQDIQRQAEHAERLRAAGVRCELLDPQQVRRLEPALAEDHHGGLYCPDDALVNPLLMLRFFLHGICRLGGSLLRHCPVLDLAPDSSGGWRLATSQAVISTKTVVNAAGIGAAALARTLGLRVPVRGDKGQQLVLRGPSATLRTLVDGAGIVAQTGSGNYLVGATREPGDATTAVTWPAIKRLAEGAVRTIPALRDAVLVRAFAGVRPVPEDGLPILDIGGPADGLITAVLHGGVTLAPLVGRLVAQAISGPVPSALTPYSLARFADAQAGP